MSNLRSRSIAKTLAAQAQKQKMLTSPNTPLGIAVGMRVKGGLRGGYLNGLNRLQKKTCAQLKGIPGCGPKLRDWLTGYDE